MSKKRIVIVEKVRLEKFVHGGQVLGEDSEGKKLFVWGGLPGELVDVRITKKRSSYREGIAVEVHEASEDRVAPEEPESYLSTSPWQIVSFMAELRHKDEILKETFQREGLDLKWSEFQTFGKVTGYRNKMEFGFWGDDDGLHLAHFVRGTHGKQKVLGSVLANDYVNDGAQSVRSELQRLGARGSDLKTVIVRCAGNSELVAAVFVKNKDLDLSGIDIAGLKGLDVYYSDPRSPASVPTEKIYTFGDTALTDKLLGVDISYGVLSFFQVNLPIFEKVLGRIDYFTGGASKIDMYSGVGAIGIPIGMTEVLVESDEQNIKMATSNVGHLPIDVVHADSEKALEYITSKRALIVDPPRAGLHKNVISRIQEVKPPQIVYLSCNPATQARDVALLQEDYKVQVAEGYNFFPRTPHIESLIVLSRR